MPTQVVKPTTIETLKPYAKLGKSNGKVQGRICALLLKLVQTDDPAKVKDLCLTEVAWLEAEYENPNTRTSYVTAYRKALSAYFAEHLPPAILLSERQTSKGLISQHCALNFLIAAPEDYAQKTEVSQAKSKAQRKNLVGFDAEAALLAIEKALKSEDWRELAAGLILAVQCRPADMLQAGKFEAVSKYRLRFTTGLKKKGKFLTGEIFCLVESAIFIDAFSRLRRMPEILEMKDWLLTEVDSGKNKATNRAVKRIFGEIIAPPHGEKELSCKNLRAAGINITYWLYGKENEDTSIIAEEQLMHGNPGTVVNYADYYVADSEGNRIWGIAGRKDAPLESKPLSEKRSSLTLDKQLLLTIADANQWGEGTHADRLDRIIARAKQADKLERQLADERDKRQKAERDLSRLQQATAKGEDIVVEVKPAVQIDEITADESSGFDWRDIPNAELKGDRRHEAYREKLRRSVEAIQDYNAGRELDEQFSITGSLLRQLTGVKPGKVKQWMDENKAALDAYNEGYSIRQNVGKPDPRSVIKWSEAAYGAYEW